MIVPINAPLFVFVHYRPTQSGSMAIAATSSSLALGYSVLALRWLHCCCLCDVPLSLKIIALKKRPNGPNLWAMALPYIGTEE